MGGACSADERTKFWLERLKGRDHSKGPGRSLDDNIKMHFRYAVFGDVDWIDLAVDGVGDAGSCEHGNRHSGLIRGE